MAVNIVKSPTPTNGTPKLAPMQSPGVDIEITTQFPPEKEAHLKELWAKMDHNEDDTASRSEVIKMLHDSEEIHELLGLHAQFEEGSKEQRDYDQCFQRMDTDGSNTVSWEEFRAFFIEIHAQMSCVRSRERWV